MEDNYVENLKNELRKTKNNLQYYKGFYDGVKTITNLVDDEDEDKCVMECASGVIKGEQAKEFKEYLDNLLKGDK